MGGDACVEQEGALEVQDVRLEVGCSSIQPYEEHQPQRLPGVRGSRGNGDPQPGVDLRGEQGAACAPVGGVEPLHEADGGLHTRLEREGALEVQDVRGGMGH